MIAGLFLNPGFLFIAAALISVPIIIHLINRMRFKRIRWAAMEFLLKAQKRTRRRLIIEQLILLALRCLLIALVGILVSRFIGCGDTNLGGKANLHIALLDDTLSMTDAEKHDGNARNAFDIAKDDFLVKKIAKGLSLSKTNDRLIIVPLSKVEDLNADMQAFLKDNTYDRLNDKKSLDKLTQDVTELKPSMMHVNMLEGVKAARKIMTGYPEARVTLHVLSDYRQTDWGEKTSEGLNKELVELAKGTKDLSIRIIDCVQPPRTKAQGGYPKSNENIGILEVTPETRVAGHRMPVRFTVKIANNGGKHVDTKIVVRDETHGRDLPEVDFTPQNPVKLTPNNVSEVTFTWGDIRRGFFFPEGFKEGEQVKYAHFSVRLTDNMQPFINDGVQGDNLRHVVIEVRERVPLLVIDGGKPAAQTLARDRLDLRETCDSFVVGVALQSVPGSYSVVFGDEISGAPATALEKLDLSKFPAIYLMNVRDLNDKQLANLEKYVSDGGGLAIHTGANINETWYNQKFFQGGKGLFPAPIKQMYPLRGDAELPPKEGDTHQILIRDELFPPGQTPIFGKMFDDARQRDPLAALPIRRYHKVNRPIWRPEKGRVHEVATLPNEDDAEKFENEVKEIVFDSATAKKVQAVDALAKYRPLFNKLAADVRDKARVGSGTKAYQLANQIDKLLTEKGVPDAKGNVLSMTDFWIHDDPSVKTMKDQLENLRKQVNYGDPFIVAQTYGKGKVVAVLSTAGKEWNDWAGGTIGSIIFPMFIWDLQKYLSSPGAEDNLTVGRTLPELKFDAEQFKLNRLKMVRTFMKTVEGKDKAEAHSEQFGRDDGGYISFFLTNNRVPGVYRSELIDDNAVDKKALAAWEHAFNVDTEREGKLQRVSQNDLRTHLFEAGKGDIKPVDIGTSDDVLVPKLNDLSESPWLFLLLLLVLVAEQALAVHLSFHLRSTDQELAPAGAKV